MALSFHGISARSIVIASHIQSIQTGSSCFISCLTVGGFIHAGTNDIGDKIEHGGVHTLHFLIRRVITATFFVVNTLALLGIGNNHQVEATGNGTGTIYLLQECHHFLGLFHALILGRLGDLVADGIHDNAGMVIVPADHGCQIRQVILAPMGCIVELVLMMEPHVPAFVHHVNAIVVTGIQHSAGAGIVGRTNGIEACVLHNADSAPLGFVIGSSANNAVIMVDTAAPEEGALSVDIETLVVPADSANTEGGNRFIALHAYLTGV